MRSEIGRHLYNLTVPLRNWWSGALGRRKAFIEGRAPEPRPESPEESMVRRRQ